MTLDTVVNVGSDWVDLTDAFSFTSTNKYLIQNQGAHYVEFFRKAADPGTAPAESDHGLAIKSLNEPYEYTNDTNIKLWARAQAAGDVRKADRIHEPGDPNADITPSFTGLVVTIPEFSGVVEGKQIHRGEDIDVTVSADGFIYLDADADTLNARNDLDADLETSFSGKNVTIQPFELAEGGGRKVFDREATLAIAANNSRIYWDPEKASRWWPAGRPDRDLNITEDGLTLVIPAFQGIIENTLQERDHELRYPVAASGFLYLNHLIQNLVGQRLDPNREIIPTIHDDEKSVVIPAMSALITNVRRYTDTPTIVNTGNLTGARKPAATIQAGASGSLTNSITVTWDFDGTGGNGVEVNIVDPRDADPDTGVTARIAETASWNPESKVLEVVIDSDNSTTAAEVIALINAAGGYNAVGTWQDFPGVAALHGSGANADTIQVPQDLTLASGRNESRGAARSGYIYFDTSNRLRFSTSARTNWGVQVCRVTAASGKITAITEVRQAHKFQYRSTQTGPGVEVAAVTVAAGAITGITMTVLGHGLTVHTSASSSAGTQIATVSYAGGAVTGVTPALKSHGVTYATSAQTDKGPLLATVSVDSGAVDGVTLNMLAVDFERGAPTYGEHRIVAES